MNIHNIYVYTQAASVVVMLQTCAYDPMPCKVGKCKISLETQVLAEFGLPFKLYQEVLDAKDTQLTFNALVYIHVHQFSQQTQLHGVSVTEIIVYSKSSLETQ